MSELEPLAKIMKFGDGGGYFLWISNHNVSFMFIDISYFSPLTERINPKNIIELLKTKFSEYELDSPINSAERHFADKFVEEIHKYKLENEKYYVSLCQDVILELLRFGTRRRLAKFERVGRRFHWNIVNFFGEKPFLRLYLNLTPGYL